MKLGCELIDFALHNIMTEQIVVALNRFYRIGIVAWEIETYKQLNLRLQLPLHLHFHLD